MATAVIPRDSDTIESPTGRAAWLVSGWRALVGLTLEAADAAPPSAQAAPLAAQASAASAPLRPTLSPVNASGRAQPARAGAAMASP